MVNLIFFLLLFLFIAVMIDLTCHFFPVNSTENAFFSKTSFKAFFSIFFILLVPAILVALRSENTGVDTPQYLKLFTQDYAQEIIVYKMHSSYEYLFWGLYYFFYQIDNVRLLFFTYAFLSLFVSFWAIYRSSLNFNPFVISLLFLLFFYQEFFNAMRQMNALAFVFLSYTFVMSRNFWGFILCLVLATLFHSSAIAAFPLYFLYPTRALTSFDFAKRIFFVLMVIVGVAIFIDIFFSLDFARHYSSYQDSLQSVTYAQTIMNFVVMYLPLILLILLFSFDFKKNSVQEKKQIDFLWSVIVVFCAFILLRFVQNWFFRLGWYYQLGEFFLIGKICQKIRKQERNLLSNWQISAPDLLVFFSVMFYFAWNFMYFDQSALINFSLM